MNSFKIQALSKIATFQLFEFCGLKNTQYKVNIVMLKPISLKK